MSARKVNIILIIVSFCLLLIAGIWIVSLYDKNKEKAIKIEGLERGAVFSNKVSEQLKRSKDSLQARVSYFQKYQSLVDVTFFRDSSQKSLKYKAGDIVLLKPDSSKAVIKEIIIGGTNYEYYVKYKILMKDRSVMEVTPEMLY